MTLLIVRPPLPPLSLRKLLLLLLLLSPIVPIVMQDEVSGTNTIVNTNVSFSNFENSLSKNCLRQNTIRFGDMMFLRDPHPDNNSEIQRYSASTIDDDDDIVLDRSPRLWPDGLVYYEISPYLYRYRALIESTMKEITSQLPYCLMFLPRAFEENYIYIDQGDSCSSYVGMIGGSQLLQLDWRCLNRGDIMHELMHTLGFLHEHQRWDRDSYLRIFRENIQDGKLTNFAKIARSHFAAPGYASVLDTPEFDFDSIMIYGEMAFTKNGLPTMAPISFNDRHGGNSHFKRLRNPSEKSELSFWNIEILHRLYCFY